MTQEEILHQLESLPPEGQRQVIDFIAFLRQHYAHLNQVREAGNSDLSQNDFIGMWRDREEMQDSSAWVRSQRESEWVKRRG
jgi:hypothetical protein